MYRVQAIDHNPSNMHLFYRDFKVLGLLFFQPVFWAEGTAALLLRQTYLGRSALPPVVGDGLSENQYWGLLFSFSFPWWVSVSFPREQK